MSRKIKFWFHFLLAAIKKPFSLLKHINYQNFKTLRNALKNESGALIIRNFRLLLDPNLKLEEPIEEVETKELVVEKAIENDKKAPKINEEKLNIFEKANTSDVDLSISPVKTIAFYLPQFHPIPENDQWWGKGFTEWTNVTKAKPLFKGHYQPHLPLDLGFYDLRIPENMEEQVKMAKSFGIHGFCFYYYWFDGKRLLEKPLDMFLDHPEWNINYCVCWANENWTRKWDGKDQEVLIAQKHSDEDDMAFIKDIEKYINDPRYITIDNKPLIVIYRPQLFPDMKATVKRWREYFRETYHQEIYLSMVQTFGKCDPNDYNFDATIEFPPLNFYPERITSKFDIPDFRGAIYDAHDIINSAKNKISQVDFNLFRGLMLNWDNTARIGKRASAFINNTPAAYESWLDEAFADTMKHKAIDDEKLVFINAWNEWAEGTHLEPDQEYGYAYLNATQRSINKLIDKTIEDADSLLFVSHDACMAGAQLVLLDIVKWISNKTSLKCKVLFISGGELQSQFSEYAETLVLNFENDLQELDSFIDKETKLIYLNSVASGSIIEKLNEFKIPILTHVHELQKSIEVYAKENMPDLLKYSSHFIACSKAVGENLKTNHEIDNDKITNIHAFVKNEIQVPLSLKEKNKLRKKLKLPTDKKIVFGVGLGLYWRKGADLFIDVCLHLKRTKDFKNTQFIWIGGFSDDNNHGEYKEWSYHLKRIEKLGLEQNIKFIGRKDNVREYLQVGDVFLLPSREDPFPLVCLEAADAYLPIICFKDAGGMPEFVQKDAGYVVPFEDINAMAEKVQYLLNKEGERTQKGEIAHQRFVENYSTQVSMAKILESMRSIGKIAPLVSIIVPNYNYAQYLDQRLDSIYNQTFQDFEVIILDDCSTDKSMNIISNYENKANTRIIINQENSGSVFHQWEKGIQQAKGKYIWLAEADDYCDNSFLEKLLPAFRDSEVQLVYSNSNAVDDKGNIESDFYNSCGYYKKLGHSAERWKSDYINNGLNEIQEVLSIKNTIPNSSAVLFRKDSFLNSNLEEIKDLKCSHDWLTYMNIIKDGKIKYLSECLNYHRRHEQSVIAKNAKDYRATLEEYHKSHEYILKHFEIDHNTQKSMENLIIEDLHTLWKDIPLKEIRKYYPKDLFKNTHEKNMAKTYLLKK